MAFFVNGRSFKILDELTQEEQDKLRFKWVKWERKVWTSSYQQLLLSRDEEGKLHVEALLSLK
jgi:hypothetical protein